MCRFSFGNSHEKLQNQINQEGNVNPIIRKAPAWTLNAESNMPREDQANKEQKYSHENLPDRVAFIVLINHTRLSRTFVYMMTFQQILHVDVVTFVLFLLRLFI
jgi:hypothetical protein